MSDAITILNIMKYFLSAILRFGGDRRHKDKI